MPRAPAATSSPSIAISNVSGRMRIEGRTSLFFMSALPMWRVGSTAASRRRRPSVSARPASSAAGETYVTDRSAPIVSPKDGRIITGCGVGIEAFGSPSAAHAIAPPLMTTAGRTPKNFGSHTTRSASLPTSIDPTSYAIPCAIAGLIVYFAT